MTTKYIQDTIPLMLGKSKRLDSEYKLMRQIIQVYWHFNLNFNLAFQFKYR